MANETADTVQMAGLSIDDPMKALEAAQEASKKEVEEAERQRQAEEATSKALSYELDPQDELNEVLDEAFAGNDSEARSIPLLQPPEAGSKDQRFIFIALSEGCMDCNAWIPGGSTEGLNLNCHYSKGNNEHCPAEHFRAKFVGTVVLMVRKYRKKFQDTETNPQRRLRMFDDLKSDLLNLTTEEMREVMKELGLM